MRKQDGPSTCPECFGKEMEWEPCYYCQGYGLVSEEDTFEAFYKEKQ